MSNVVRTESFQTKKRHLARKSQIEQKNNEIPKRYDGDIRRYLEYCTATDQPDGTEAMLDYLYISLTDQRIKKNTWERRLAAIRKHLTVVRGVNFKTEPGVSNELAAMRKMYIEEQNADLIQTKGKSAVDKQELLDVIYRLPIRERAITLVNLITANRPNEMVRLKVKDFDLDARVVSVYLKKQKIWHNKRITQEVAKTVRDYFKKYNLKDDDYFVGRVYKGGRYSSVEISEIGYTKALQKWTGLTGYNFRKSQVVAMHEAGADLPTIAKQTGHRSLDTLSKHYLTVSDSTVDKYL